MKTTISPATEAPSSPLSTDEFHRRNAEWRARFRGMTKAQQRKMLIRIGALTPEGKIPVYPMDDHVPLGPRE